jgi:hypothetical protein
MSAKVTPLIASLVRTYYCGANKELMRLARVPAGTSMAPTRFTSGALITRNNFVHSTEGSRDPAPLDARAGFSFSGRVTRRPTEPNAVPRRKARASSTIAADRLGRRHQNKNDALRNTNGRQSHEIADPRIVADRRCRAVRDHRAYCDGSSFRRRRCAGDQSGGRERGGGKRDGADRALDSYFVPLPPCRHTSAGLLAHLLGRPLDPDAERSAQSSGRTSSVRLSALRDQII